MEHGDDIWYTPGRDPHGTRIRGLLEDEKTRNPVVVNSGSMLQIPLGVCPGPRKPKVDDPTLGAVAFGHSSRHSFEAVTVGLPLRQSHSRPVGPSKRNIRTMSWEHLTLSGGVRVRHPVGALRKLRGTRGVEAQNRRFLGRSDTPPKLRSWKPFRTAHVRRRWSPRVVFVKG